MIAHNQVERIYDDGPLPNWTAHGCTATTNPFSNCYSVLFAGAGIRGGTVYGESDAQAAYVKDLPVSTADICATIYHCLGIPPETRVPDETGRPVEISHGGRPIEGILT